MGFAPSLSAFRLCELGELYIEIIGSPSGTKEQDIITWMKLAGASKVSGEAVFDGGGDVDAFTF